VTGESVSRLWVTGESVSRLWVTGESVSRRWLQAWLCACEHSSLTLSRSSTSIFARVIDFQSANCILEIVMRNSVSKCKQVKYGVQKINNSLLKKTYIL